MTAAPLLELGAVAADAQERLCTLHALQNGFAHVVCLDTAGYVDIGHMAGADYAALPRACPVHPSHREVK